MDVYMMKIAYCNKCGNRFDVERDRSDFGTGFWQCPDCGWDLCLEVVPVNYRSKHHWYNGADRYD